MKRLNKHGFSLIELMITLAITSVVVAGIFGVYRIQLQSKVIQEQMIELQQNLRAALHLMEKDIRMAGYDPLQTAGAGIDTIMANQLVITMDIDNDAGTDTPDGDTGDANEQIGYQLTAPIDGATALGRTVGGGGAQPVAENIEVINFVYLDRDGNTTNDRLAVQSIQITILGRTKREIVGAFSRPDNRPYRNLQGAIILQPTGDAYRRLSISTEVLCRNLNPV